MILEIVGSESLCARARKLIADGADPAEPVEWTRRGVPVFTTANPLGWWAEREVDGRTRLVRCRRTDLAVPAAFSTLEVV